MRLWVNPRGIRPDGGGEATLLRQPDVATNQHFPTNSKEKEKLKDAENKAKGIDNIVKRKPNVIEKHYDDCGNGLGGLGEFFQCRCCDGYSSSSDEEN